MIEFSPTFDLKYYQDAYPELHGLPEAVVRQHYLQFAEAQGHTTCLYDRSEYMKAFLNANINNEKVLEIGPFDRPFLRHGNVKYFDVMDSAALAKRAVQVGRTHGHVPDKIDYIDADGDLSIIDEVFDIVISSHLIEHQPNLIKHFQIVENLLDDNGMYILYIPDKRYCFDYYIPETTISELVNAHIANPKIHSFKNIVEHCSMTVHNDPIGHWFGNHGSNEIDNDNFVRALDLFMNSNGAYIDVHAWQFTPRSFGKIINDLNKLNLINLQLHRLCHTIFGRQEFCAILKKNPHRV